MKKSELFFSFLLAPLDFLMLILAGISAYYIRFSEFTTEIRPIIFNLKFQDFLQVVLAISSIWVIIFALAGLYSIKEGPKKLGNEIYRVILACSTGFMLIAVLIFLRRELFDSRFIVLAFFALAILYISLARLIVRIIQRNLFKYNIGIHKALLVGSGRTVEILEKNFEKNKRLGYEVVKTLDHFNEDNEKELQKFLENNLVDEIIQADSELGKDELLRLYNFADTHHLTFKYTADLTGTKVLKTEVSEMAGIPIVEVKKTSLEGWGKIVKRIFDIILALFFIILFAPLMFLIAFWVKLDSRGAIIYKNKRVGKGGKIFNVLKFRSMKTKYCVGEETKSQEALLFEKKLIEEQNSKEGPVYKIKDDPRLTRSGRFIRRWSLDELPQFFNVLTGSMSIVGPRPHQEREVAKYKRHHKKVLTIKPGITGMAQVSGRSDLDFEEEVKLDTYYIENWAFARDIKILLKTPMAVLRDRKVY